MVQRKPGAFRNGAPFKGVRAGTKRLRAVLVKRNAGDRDMADILALVRHNDEKLVEQAVEESVDSEVISKTHIVNRLSRLLDTPRPQTPTPSPTLPATRLYGQWSLTSKDKNLREDWRRAVHQSMLLRH